MLEIAFRTDQLPTVDRLAMFDQFQLNSPYPMRAASEEPEQFCAEVRTLDLGVVNVVEMTCTPVDVVRSSALVRQFDPELYSIVLPRRGCVTLSQAGRVANLAEGDLALYTSSAPFHVNIDAPTGASRLLRVQVPSSALPHPSAAQLDRLVARRLSGQRGVARLLSRFLGELTDGAVEYRASDLPRLGNVVIDLMMATLAREAETIRPRGDARQQTLFPRITAFVRENLHDTELSPGVIAAAHHISVSYLHRLFQNQETTVGAWIRAQRLERARRDLTDPHQRAVPIHRIATRWGFGDHATFTRAFRARFGLPPRDYRHVNLPATC